MKPKNPNPFYMVYQSFWTELRLKGAVKEVFAVIYGRCAYSGNAAEIYINAIATLTGLSRQTIISSIDVIGQGWSARTSAGKIIPKDRAFQSHRSRNGFQRPTGQEIRPVK